MAQGKPIVYVEPDPVTGQAEPQFIADPMSVSRAALIGVLWPWPLANGSKLIRLQQSAGCNVTCGKLGMALVGDHEVPGPAQF